MSIFHIALIIGALVAALLSWGDWRAIGWLVAAQISLAVSVAYWGSGLPYAEAVAGMCDAAICLCVYFWGRFNWELVVWRAFQLSVLVNIVYLAGNIGIFATIPHDVYASLLEFINWSVILFIGGAGLLRRINGNPGWARRRFRNVGSSLYRERAEAPFTARRSRARE